MTDTSYLAVVVLLIGIVANRFIAESALKLLTAEKKAELVDSFSTQRRFGLLIVVVIIIATFREPFWMALALTGYFVASQIWGYSRLRKLQLPSAYTRRFLVAACVLLVAIVVFVTLQFWLR